MFKKNLPKEKVDSTFSVFSSNVASINRNLENVLILLDELDFHFNVIGITETKITNSNEDNFHLLKCETIQNFPLTALLKIS